MARPPEYPDWATTDVVDGTSGQNNVVSPSGAKRLVGWNRREKPPRQWFNWMGRLTGQWIRRIVVELDELFGRTITAGTGLTGGGDLSADRTISLDFNAIGAPVLLETVDITAVANIDLPTVFSDNPGYEYYRVVIDAADWFGGVGFYMLLSVDGSTFSTTASDYDPAMVTGVGIGDVRSDSRVWADVLFINSGSSTGVTSIQGRGSSIDGTTVLHENIQSAFVGSEDAITGFRLRGDGDGGGGGFVAGGSVKVYGSQAPF